MRRSLHILILLLTAVSFFTCTKDQIPTVTSLDKQLTRTLESLSPNGSKNHFALPDSDDFANIPQDPINPLTKEKVELGKMLFFETGLALDSKHNVGRGTYSCASCHLPENGFMPGRQQGIADGGIGFGEQRTKWNQYGETELDVQGARPLSLLNVAYVTNTTWSGKFGAGNANEGTEYAWSDDTELNHLGMSGLETQNIEGLKLHRMVVNRAVLDSYGYTPLFDRAFQDIPVSERYTPKAFSFAVSAYLRSLLSNQAPFQEWIKGNADALNEQQKRGALLFYGKANCYSCHSGPSLSNTEFYAVGVKDLYQKEGSFNTNLADKRNLGRGGFTGRQEDMYKFKIPQIYNMKDSPFYFHGSSKRTLREVVEYFNEAEPENPNMNPAQLAPQFQPLNMTEQEIQDLTEFLANGLRDPNLERYVPETILSGNCFPNNDPLSRVASGCE